MGAGQLARAGAAPVGPGRRHPYLPLICRPVRPLAHNPELMQWLKLSLLRELGDPDEAYTVGDVVQFPPTGRAATPGVVRELGETAVLFDFNHPFGRPAGAL